MLPKYSEYGWRIFPLLVHGVVQAADNHYLKETQNHSCFSAADQGHILRGHTAMMIEPLRRDKEQSD